MINAFWTMFRSPILKNLTQKIRSYGIAHCDVPDAGPEQTILDAADAEIENAKPRIQTPMPYDTLKSVMGMGQVPAFDGLRVTVSKSINMNSAVNHQYWLGSQLTGQQIYQYRLVYQDEEKYANMGTDLDFNMDGEVKKQLSERATIKARVVLNDNVKALDGDMDYLGETFAATGNISQNQGTSMSGSYMQSLSPSLVMGGTFNYIYGKNIFSSGYAAAYDTPEYMVAAAWDKEVKLFYQKRVNPNRVHLSTDLTIDEQSNASMGCSAEYMLKQGKVHFGVDSNMVVKSYVETAIAQGQQLQVAAEMQHSSDTYRFGIGLTLGS